jgi:hypothetical protein
LQKKKQKKDFGQPTNRALISSELYLLVLASLTQPSTFTHQTIQTTNHKLNHNNQFSPITIMTGLPPFLARIMRPFTHSSRLSLAPATDSNGAASGLAANQGLCTVAAGCFWGTEYIYRKHFAGKGLIDAKVGYTGGDLTNPSYRAVCGGKTGREYPPLAHSAIIYAI